MSIIDKVRGALDGLALPGQKVTIEPSGPYKVVASVVTEAFTHMPEEQRQTLVWKRLLSELDDAELARIEFVFTDSPSDEALPEQQAS